MLDDTVPDAIRHLARKNFSLVLRAMDQVTQKRISELIGLSEPALSEFKTRHLERVCLVLAACSLRLAPSTDKTYSPQHISALNTLASMALDAMKERTDFGALDPIDPVQP